MEWFKGMKGRMVEVAGTIYIDIIEEFINSSIFTTKKFRKQ